MCGSHLVKREAYFKAKDAKFEYEMRITKLETNWGLPEGLFIAKMIGQLMIYIYAIFSGRKKLEFSRPTCYSIGNDAQRRN